MKQLTIGRHNSCDIVIPDTTDIVSRRQAVLCISFFGKMKIIDTSNNGTFVNGERLTNGKSMPVTRTDKVNFGRVAELDWSLVHDPYHKHKVWGTIAVVASLLTGCLLFWWYINYEQEDLTLDLDDIEIVTPQCTETTQDVKEEPAVTIPVAPRHVAPRRKVIKRTPVSTSTPNPGKKEEKTEETSKNHAPLVY